MEPVTLVSPSGFEIVVTTPIEMNNLIYGEGYKTLRQVNDENEKEYREELAAKPNAKAQPTPKVSE